MRCCFRERGAGRGSRRALRAEVLPRSSAEKKGKIKGSGGCLLPTGAAAESGGGGRQ